jgi:hypothetical protein
MSRNDPLQTSWRFDRRTGYGQRCAVADCRSSSRQEAGAVVDDNFVARFKSVCDEILARLRSCPLMTAAEDSRAQRNALAELNRKNAEFWSKQ